MVSTKAKLKCLPKHLTEKLLGPGKNNSGLHVILPQRRIFLEFSLSVHARGYTALALLASTQYQQEGGLAHHRCWVFFTDPRSDRQKQRKESKNKPYKHSKQVPRVATDKQGVLYLHLLEDGRLPGFSGPQQQQLDLLLLLLKRRRICRLHLFSLARRCSTTRGGGATKGLFRFLSSRAVLMVGRPIRN